jgi:carbonic anhydrase/acetyltransferase-like protein (isoleucine patch superfamily)
VKQRIMGSMPEIKDKHYIHTTACVIGGVFCKGFLSVWPNAVLRADTNRIQIGSYVNIQDNAGVYVSRQYRTTIGNYVTVGHHAVLHACEIGDNTLIGMGAIIMDGAIVGKNCIIGAGALVLPDSRIPDNSLVIGSPHSILRNVTEEEIAENAATAERYWKLALEYIRTGDVY